MVQQWLCQLRQTDRVLQRMHLPEPAYIQFPSVMCQPPLHDLGCSALATTSRTIPCLYPKIICRVKTNGDTTEKIFENGRHRNSLYSYPSPPDGLEDFLRKSLANRGSSESIFCSVLHCWLWPMLGYTPGFTTLPLLSHAPAFPATGPGAGLPF